MPEPLPELTENASIRDLLLHTRVNNVLGFAVYYSADDALAARRAQADPAGLGHHILTAYDYVNWEVPEPEQELGVDLYFRHPYEVHEPPEVMSLQLAVGDADILLERLPSGILDSQTGSF